MRALVPLLLASFAFAQEPPAQTPAAQTPAAGPFGHSRHGAEFDEGPRQAAYPMAGMNPDVHFPVHGLSGDAQRFFDQGIVQLHGFWYFEAERSFRQVAMLHPDCAMAHWGMALANIENEPRAAQCIANAVRCSATAPPREQRWVDAWAAFHGIDDGARAELRSGDGPRAQKQKDVLTAANKDRTKDAKENAFRLLLKDLGTLVHEDPHDVEAKAFLAIYIWHAYDWGNGIAIPSHAAVDALLDPVFTKVPLHPAHHYRVHLWDREKAEHALGSAAALGDSAPGIAHQWHMAGHIYAQLDRHAEAAWQQEASARVDHAHMQRDRVLPFLIHNYGHNQEWLARSLSYVGRAAEALAVAKNLAGIPRHPKHNKLDDGQHIAAYARKRLVSVCEDHELWADAVQLDADGLLDAGDSVKSEVMRLGLLGRAYFRLGRLDEGKRIVAETDSLLGKARAQRAAAVDKAEDEAFAKKTDRTKAREVIAEAGREPTSSVESVLDLRRELRGEELLASGDAKGALEQLEAVKDLPKTLLADAFVAAGQPEKAIELLEKEAKDHPNRVPTLGRLLLACLAAAKPEHDARVAELRTLLATAQFFAIDSGALAQRAGLLGKPGPGQRLSGRGDGEPSFAEAGYAVGADFGPRPPLASLGPMRWQPFANPGFSLPWVAQPGTTVAMSRGGRTWELHANDDSDSTRKPTLVVFYLGFGCMQCVEQLHALSPRAAAFAAAGIDVVAIGNDTLGKTADAVAALPAERHFPFALLADPELTAFKAWHCFDDFEQMPLHGTFLVDGNGKVLWQDVSAEPFTQFEWLLGEARRLLAIP